ncbi:MAG: formimidoylglutamate deiminase [Spongiibacteraceae bacterium]|nr:formimidoylglutamate deiminase [Spongiibacteraceae bacterium]
MHDLFFEYALLPQGWTKQVRLGIDCEGNIHRVDIGSKAAGARAYPNPVVAGMPNLHCHAFQRALAGLTEYRNPNTPDNFWSWRTQMYRLAKRITPEQLRVIASQLYIEMLKSGFTCVGEFHYLHHDTQGHPYKQPYMSEAIIEAAEISGINLTLLPVLYMQAGLNSNDNNSIQQRFYYDPEHYLALIQQLQTLQSPRLRIGIAPHSLRTVPSEPLISVVKAFTQMDQQGPIHIHIAEQQQEVKEFFAHHNQRPVDWLLEHLPVDQRWCLIHATHLNTQECTDLARSGAIAGLCPTTEANLGDGLFRLPEFIQAQGRFGVGSDSNCSVSATEELRWLEYGQRLVHQRRNIASTPQQIHTGTFLWQHALAGGAQALGQTTGRIDVGYRADLLVLNRQQQSLHPKYYLDNLLFNSHNTDISTVLVAGQEVILNGHHAQEEKIATEFATVMNALSR